MVTWKRVTHPGDTPTEHVALTAGRQGRPTWPGTCGPRWPLVAGHPKNRGNLMRYRLLGKSGVRISEVALGTMTFGEDWGWGASPEVSARMLDLFAAGGNVIDTADVYTNGTSETIVGELLKGRRDRFVLGTKFTNQTDPDDPNSAGNHRKKIVTSLEASLR